MGLNSARNALTAITKDFKGFSKQVGMAAGSFAAFSALTTARQFTVEAVEATQRFERNVLALNQVFEDAAPSLMAFTKEVENYGLSQSQAAQASVFLGSVLKQYGFDVNDANAQTQNLVKLAQDLATTFGYDVQEALLAITALFRGEYDPIEKFGVAMKQNEINAVRAARGLGNLTGAAEMQADAQIRLELLFERAGDSMGAFERATNTLYGSQQLLNAALQNLMVSAGAPLQEPLAQINNLFAALVSEAGPELTEVFDAIGGAIDTVAPTIEKLARGALNLVEMLEQVVEVIDLVLTPVLNGLNVALDIVNPALELLGTILDGISAIFENINLHLRRFGELLKSTPLAPFIEGLEWLSENGFGIGAAFKFLNDQIEKQNQLLQATNGNFIETSSGAREASSAMRKAGTAARETQEDLENMAAANKAWTDSWTARAVKFAEDNGIALNEIFKKNIVTGAAQTGTDYVSDFFQGIEDSVKKEAARIKLAAMGASEGLIEAILGAGGWEQVYNRVIKGGIEGLKDLQREFNQTAAGIQELTDAIKEAEKAQQALRDAAQKAIDDNIARLEAEFKKAEAYFVQVQQKAEEFKRWSLDNISNIQILPDFETQLGKFESAIVSTIQGIQNQLISAVRSGLIFEDDFANLQRWVDTESVALMEIARRRDELANRYSLSESLIREYQTALTSALSLTGLFGRLKDETETKTVSEVTSGVVKLSGSLKEFNLTVTRSYEETIQKVIDKSEGLVQGFRDIAQKARDFAENLRKLRDMGLDPMLFNQLVSAGVEAGGETAQALVDGGSETVNEINSIFDEINQLGAELGMDVGQTMYDAGKDITYGLLDGIKSEQEQLYELATEMARTFSETFKNNFSVAIDQPVKAAESAANTAKAALDQAKDANVDALVQINELIAGAEKALSGKLSSAFRAGVEGKLGAFEAVRQDIISGQVTDIGGLTRGLTSAKAEELLKGTGGTTVNNYYNVEVKADTRTQGAKAGEALVNQINKFEQTSGTTDVSRLLAV
jgi:translation initiation factor 2B subunit (eIF-2B alpha/beta/delta family)